MKSLSCFALALLLMTGIAVAKEVPDAKEIPDAPSAVMAAQSFVIARAVPVRTPSLSQVETKTIDSKFIVLTLISSGSTFADSYTTLFARQNWLAGKKGVCNVEVESAYLYGTHPTVGRAYAVASAKTMTSVLAAYYLRKHHHKFWSLPLVANAAVSLHGVTQNMRTCN